MATFTDGAQEQLFASSARGSERYGVPSLDEFYEDPAVEIVARNLHLVNALDGMSAISSRLGFIDALGVPEHRARIADRYQTPLDRMSEGARSKTIRMGREVKWEFARAIGLMTLGDSDESRAIAREEFALFRDEYEGTLNAEKRLAFIGRLMRNIDTIQGTYTEDRRAAKHPRTKKADNTTAVAENLSEVAQNDMHLNITERMRALLSDPRAGFLAPTHTERNQALAFLDYIDNPKYHLGIENQFYEIFNHQERVYKSRHGRSARGEAGTESLVSLTYQMIDFHANAMAQVEALQELQLLINDCPNPNVTLAEEIGEAHRGYAPLVRYMDLKEISQGTDGKVKGFAASPMSPIRNEDGLKDSERNKVLEDRYTGEKQPPEFAERIAQQVRTLKIGDMRSVINAAITNEHLRCFFHEKRLYELLVIERIGYLFPEVGDIVSERLEIVEETQEEKDFADVDV